jgi:hypothetical protein
MLFFVNSDECNPVGVIGAFADPADGSSPIHFHFGFV